MKLAAAGMEIAREMDWRDAGLSGLSGALQAEYRARVFEIRRTAP